LYTSGPPAQQDDELSDTVSECSELVVEDDRKAQVEGALDLLEHLMDPDCTTRFTAYQALQHYWLRESNDIDYDNEFFPHPVGQGVCAALHRSGKSGENVIRNGTKERSLVSGEGMAIGYSPCEFHSLQAGELLDS
jgi:cell division control protein 7